MPFQSKRAPLPLNKEEREELLTISRSRTGSRQLSERASILLRYADGESISSISRALHTTRPLIERCINKALQFGVMGSLKDMPGRGRKRSITDEDLAWLIELACQKPKDLGYPHELWTMDLLAKHVRKHCVEAGHSSLNKLARGTVSKLLSKQEVRPHKIKYYLERRDPEFERKKAEVLCVYREVEMLRAKGTDNSMVAVLSYDEKPGIQAIGTTSPDLPPVPGQHACHSRDHEYVRHGTVSLMGAIDLLSGRIHGQVVDRHRSCEFIGFLKQIDQAYPKEQKIRMVLDNHSAHVSKETRAYLTSVPNRFEFVFTPKHGSWLNLVETFFSKLARTMLRGIRVDSKDELKSRILQYLQLENENPVVFRWKYQLENDTVA
jgi:transposase